VEYEACRTCSDWARQHGEDAAGTATGYDQFLIVEVPLPWPYAVTEAKGFPPGLLAVIEEGMRRGLSFRFEAIAPDPEWSRPGKARVIQYKLVKLDVSLDEKVCFYNGFAKQEFLVPVADVAGVAAALLYEPERLAGYSAWAVDVGPVRDLLVCTQGSRDAACGHYGYPLYREIRFNWCNEGDLRVWRASHIGGHRFAGTLLDFPAGISWGYVTDAALGPLLRQTAGPEAIAHCYRGALAPVTHWEQIAEREALLQTGWAWLSGPRRTAVVQEGPDGATVLVESLSPPRRWQATLRERGQVQSQPNTKGPLRMEVQYGITDWVEVNRPAAPTS
jgi:hypothetical protein